MFGSFIYLSTLVYVPHAIILAAPLLLLIQNPRCSFQGIYNFIKKPNLKVNPNNFIVLTIVFGSLINMILHRENFQNWGDFLPYFILIPVTYYAATVVKPVQWKWLIYFVAFECFIGIFQFIIGQPSFFPEFLRFPEAYDPNLLYYRRVYGLSISSSTFANKILVALLLLDYAFGKSKFKNVLRIILWIGLFVTFNRTVLIVVIIYYALLFIKQNLKYEFKPTRFFLTAFVVIIGSGLLFALIWKYSGEIITQFTRNREGLDISGRDHIWAYFLEFIRTHFFFGNGGFKVYFNDLHAHNSFLQVLATNGFVLFMLYLYLVVRNLKTESLIPITILIIYSLTQYGIFWGISLMDIAFFYFLFRTKGPQDDFEFKREKQFKWKELFPLTLPKKSVKVDH